LQTLIKDLVSEDKPEQTKKFLKIAEQLKQKREEKKNDQALDLLDDDNLIQKKN
jgi:hypothetical protein